ncbi:MAG: HD domain-containing phosphohydrolase [Pseudomonadota bacterium]
MSSADEVQTQAAAELPPTLLLVDDEQNILAALRRLFRPEGYRILLAGNGQEGLAVLEQEPVDLVISDMRMPVMDGAQFLEQVATRWPDTMRILLTGHADLSSAIAAINKGSIYKYIAKPWEDNDLKLNVKHALNAKFLDQERRRLEILTRRQNEELKDLNANLERKVAERTAELQQAHESLKKSYASSIKTFAGLIEMREGSIGGHSRRVADLAHRLALSLGMNKAQAQDVLFAGLLHDIGKIALPDKLMSTPFQALGKEDRAKVARHVVLGEAALMALEPLQEAAKYIRHHHELYDGRGYPDGLQGEAIPLGAQILCLANEYDALQIGTINTQRMSAAEAREYIAEKKYKRYGPKVVDAFLAHFEGAKPKAVDLSEQFCTGELQPGMVITRDLVMRDGMMLLSAGYVLDETLIERIRRFEKGIDERLTIHAIPPSAGEPNEEPSDTPGTE